MDEPKTGDETIWLGKLKLTKLDGERVWIGDGTGEGGEFDSKELERVLSEFYTKHF